MNIYEIRWTSIDEKSWISGNTIIHALKTYSNICGFDLWQFDSADNIVELPRDRWSQHFISDEDGLPDKTFEEWMEENKDSAVIAETME